MTKFRNAKIAAIALIMGIVSTFVFARPTCEDMKALCDGGAQNWCYMWQNDPSCH